MSATEPDMDPELRSIVDVAQSLSAFLREDVGGFVPEKGLDQSFPGLQKFLALYRTLSPEELKGVVMFMSGIMALWVDEGHEL